MIVTESIPLACSPRTAWKLLADGGQWPRWAIRNVLASEPLDENRWETPRGPGVLHIRGLENFGILDHDFIDAQEGKCTVPARVISVQRDRCFS